MEFANSFSRIFILVLIIGLVLPAFIPANAMASDWTVENTSHGFQMVSGDFTVEIDASLGTVRKVMAGNKPLVWANSKPLLSASTIESKQYDQITDFIPDVRLLEATYTPKNVAYLIDGDKAVVTISGDLTFPGDDGIEFELQLTGIAGEQLLTAHVQLAPRGEFANRYVRNVNVHLPLAVNYRKRVAQGGDQGFTWDTRYFYQFHLGTRHTLLTEPERNEWALFGIEQSSPVAYRIWRSESESTSPLVMQQGMEAAGWSAVHDEEGGVLFAYRNMALHAPKSLRVDARERGEVIVSLHPDSMRAIHPYSHQAAQHLFDPLHQIDMLFFEGLMNQQNPQARLAALWGVPGLASDPPIRPEEKFMAAHDEWLTNRMTSAEHSPWVSGGVALPRGQVRDPYAIRLFDGERELEFESEPLAYWPDQSIKWLLLTFRYDTVDVIASDKTTQELVAADLTDVIGDLIPFEVTLRDGSRRNFSLGYAESSKRPVNQVSVVERADVVTINTGPLKVDIGPGTHWIRQISLNGKAIVRTTEEDEPIAFIDFLRVDDTYPTMTTHPSGEPAPGPVVIENIEVENAGPFRTVVRLEGHAQSDQLTKVIIRLEAYAGQAFLRMNHTVEFSHQDPRRLFVRQMGIRLPLLLDEETSRVVMGGEAGPVELDGDWNIAGLRQREHLEYAMWRQYDAVVEELEHGHRSGGWIDVSDGTRGATLAMRNFWQYAPNELVASRHDSTLTSYFWPASVPLMDVRRYSNYPHLSQGESVRDRNDWVETSYYGNDPFVGVSRTHEVLWFFREEPVENEELEAVAADFQSPPLIYMGEAWYRENGLALPQPDPDIFPTVTENRDNVMQFWLYHQKMFGWYGKWYYGDIQHAFNAGYGWILPRERLIQTLEQSQGHPTGALSGGIQDYMPQHHWAFDNGRWGWGNTEGLPGLLFQQEYLRTGDREFFFLAEAMARQARDVVIRHSGRWFGRGTRHGVQPWSDGNHEERQTVHSEFRFHYYLTGDKRTREVAQKLLNNYYLLEDVSVHASHSGRLYGLLTNWEMSGDAKLGDILRRYVHTFIVPEGISGAPRVSFPSVTVLGHNPDHINTDDMFFHVFGATHALIEYYYLTYDEALREALIRMANALMVKLPTRPSSGNPSWLVIAFAARHADNPQPYREFLERWFKREAWEFAYRMVSGNPDHWTGPGAFIQAGVVGSHFWMNALPYLMSSFDQEPELSFIERTRLSGLDQVGKPGGSTFVSWQSEFDVPQLDDYLGKWRPWTDPVRITLPEIIETTSPIRGTIPLDVQVIQLGERGSRVSDDSEWDVVNIWVDDTIVYSDHQPPRPRELYLDTYQLEDGRHELTVEVFHKEHGRFMKRAAFLVRNRWQLVDELLPPVSGFFGSLDRLRVEEKSDGWIHVEDQPEIFGGDSSRLSRADSTQEYLVWAAPTLTDLEVIAFLREVDVETAGLTLAISSDGEKWEPLSFEQGGLTASVIGESEDGWRSIVLHAHVDVDAEANWFRLSLEEGFPPDHAQIGKVTLKGLVDAPPMEQPEISATDPPVAERDIDVSDPSVVEPDVYVFFDDFTEDEPGESPSNWILSNTIPQYGTIEVVADEDVPSGRAIHFRTTKFDRLVSVNMRTPAFGEMAESAKTLAIEYWYKWVEGTAVYHYISTGSAHKMTFLTSSNHFRNRETREGSTVSATVANLKEGWNQIRFVVDREANSVVFFVNDMENPIPGNFGTRDPIESWEDMRILIVHETNANQFREAYYSGFKVWVVE